MKKVILAALSLILFVSVTTAQQDSLKAKRMHQAQQNKEMMKDLNLSQDQKTKMQAIRQDTKTKREAITNNKSLTKEEQQKQLKQLRETTQKSINDLLTPQQQEQLKRNKQEVKHSKKGTNPL